jgi:hypothetical protein
LLVEDEFGFRTNLRTKKATYELINEIASVLNGKLGVGDIFCDLGKVFHCVHCDILLSKLNFFGTIGKANEWIKSYLRLGMKE